MNNSVAGDLFWAPVTLPSGAEINYLGLYVRDNLSGADITATLRGYSGTTTPGYTDIVSIATVGFGLGPYYFSSNQIAHTVNNDVGSGGGYQYTVVISTTGSLMDFKAVDIWWHRQVSPAPGTATFNDVPTSDGAFQFIEAFSAAQITVGCNISPPMYCPDDPVTRRQMAVFFAKALGLYWQY